MNLENVLAKNRSLKNHHAGKRCFIVGNGPSLKQQDLKLLKDEITIVVNSFFRHPGAKEISPNYWVLADSLCWENPEEFFFPTLHRAINSAICTNLVTVQGGDQTAEAED